MSIGLRKRRGVNLEGNEDGGIEMRRKTTPKNKRPHGTESHRKRRRGQVESRSHRAAASHQGDLDMRKDEAQ